MAMSEARKKLQNKLRNKFRWHTNTNYNRGLIMERCGDENHHNYLAFNLSWNNYNVPDRDIIITIRSNNQLSTVSLSFEEFLLISRIVDKFKQEKEDNIKNLKERINKK